MKLPNGIARTFGRQILQFKKNSPTLMFGAGVVTAVGATVYACKATLKLEAVLDKHEKDRQNAEQALALKGIDYTQKDYDHDLNLVRVKTAKDVAFLYAPAVGLGVVSLGLLTGAHITLTKRNAALIAAYNLLDKGFKEYRSRVREELGDDKDREFFFGAVDKEIVEDGAHGHEVKTVKRASGAHSVYARPFDEYNRHWSNSPIDNRSYLLSIQSYMNDLLHARGHVLLNDAYDALGLERSPAGAVVGWVRGNKDDMVDFGLFRKDDPVMNDFMNLEHNDGIMLDFNVDGIVYDMISDKKY